MAYSIDETAFDSGDKRKKSPRKLETAAEALVLKLLAEYKAGLTMPEMAQLSKYAESKIVDAAGMLLAMGRIRFLGLRRSTRTGRPQKVFGLTERYYDF